MAGYGDPLEGGSEDMGEGPESSEPADEYTQETMRLAQEAFPDQEWTPERADKLAELLAHCGGGGGMDMGPEEKNKPSALLLALKPKKD